MKAFDRIGTAAARSGQSLQFHGRMVRLTKEEP
jgi:hypothetical protein